ncbi:dienelactone hydrolase family protein [Actinomycetospora sp. OC33-EN08]|uniref:Dienelactone hydrolase family protein n=1 Tax=Actinomycetospora aurantiaca TaxID=3129233 RepID=A0ABU8MQT4_9PSEU
MTTRTETIPLVDDTELAVTVGAPDDTPVRGGIVVLHSSQGVTERTVGILDGLADEGWLVVAPHLFHGSGSADDVSGASVLTDSDASFGWLADHGVPADRMGILGFDLGATAALVVASQRSLGAAVTVAAAGVKQPLADGLPPLLDVVGELTCPWLGLYGETGDPVDPADVERLREAAHASGSVVDVVVYPAAEHRFDDTDDPADAARPDTLDESEGAEGTRSEARHRVLNWFDAHLR